MSIKFHTPGRTVWLIIGVLGGLVLTAMQAGCAPEPIQTFGKSLAQAPTEQAERQHAVENVSEALGQRLDQMLTNTNRLSQR